MNKILLDAAQVGVGIKPNQRLNKEIHQLLGLNTPAHDYVHSLEHSTSELKKLGVYSYCLPSIDGGWASVFEFAGEPHVTTVQKEESHAVAITLFYILQNKSVVT